MHPGTPGCFFTSKDITSALADQGTKVGTATVYRNLERLEEEGIIARTSIEGTSSICYRFLPDAPEDVYFFLKCEECGNLSPIDCGELQKLYEHVIEHHHVRINPTKRCCTACAKHAWQSAVSSGCSNLSPIFSNTPSKTPFILFRFCW